MRTTYPYRRVEEWSVHATVYVDPYGHARLSIEEGWLSFLFTPLYMYMYLHNAYKSHVCSYFIENNVFFDLLLSHHFWGCDMYLSIFIKIKIKFRSYIRR